MFRRGQKVKWKEDDLQFHGYIVSDVFENIVLVAEDTGEDRGNAVYAVRISQLESDE